MNHMKKVPFSIREFLSTGHIAPFQTFDDPIALAEFWPMRGRRVWAEECLAWLNVYLAGEPSAKDAFFLIHEGWHDNVILTDEKNYGILLQALRDRLAREILHWDDAENFFDRERN